jgi:hypothetical protein
MLTVLSLTVDQHMRARVALAASVPRAVNGAAQANAQLRTMLPPPIRMIPN